MRIIGNVIWIIFGGFISWLAWILAGCFWCITVVGIPVGLQCFKLASISLNPFGKDVESDSGCFSFLMNIVWFLISGIEMAALNFFLGCILCITIVGIPFGKQFFKIAKVALMPFGTTVRRVRFA